MVDQMADRNRPEPDAAPPEWAMRRARDVLSGIGYTEASPGWIAAAEVAVARAIVAVRRETAEEAALFVETHYGVGDGIRALADRELQS